MKYIDSMSCGMALRYHTIHTNSGSELICEFLPDAELLILSNLKILIPLDRMRQGWMLRMRAKNTSSQEKSW
jgi:hypothetical protein